MTAQYAFRTFALRASLALLPALALSACGHDLAYAPALEVLERYDRTPPQPEHFAYCFDHGCRTSVDGAALGADWPAIAALFAGAAATPAKERARMAAAVARFERSMGARYGTAGDKGGTFTTFGRSGQLDCVDEALNTTTLLRLLETQGLLAWHDVGAPAQRGYMLDSWPHATAVVHERRSEKSYAVDSWFKDNGQAADVVPLPVWLAGWTPE